VLLVKNIIKIVLAALIVQGCNPKSKQIDKAVDAHALGYVIRYQKDGKTIEEEIKDTFLIGEVKRMQAEGANYTPREEKTDERDAEGRLLIKRAGHSDQVLFGASYTKYSYDASGNLIKQETLDKNDKWVNAVYDIAVEEHKYDSRNNCIESRFFDKDYKPAVVEMGPHVIQTRYNEKNEKTQILFLDVNEVALANFAKIEFLYDQQGNLIEEIHYSGQGKEIKRVKK